MALLTNLYVQSLGVALPLQDSRDELLFEKKISSLKSAIDECDAVVVGIGSGMSTAAGYDFYHASEDFDSVFGRFSEAHGFETLFDGLYHVFSEREEQ